MAIRHTHTHSVQPLGHAVAMVLVPAMHGGNSRVFLWNRNNVSSPRHIFTGHSESVLEVQWRRHRGGKWGGVKGVVGRVER